MIQVVYAHSMEFLPLTSGDVMDNHMSQDKAFVANMQYMMPGFTLISGVFSASGVIPSPGQPKQSIIRNQSYLTSFRDLILIQVTAPLLLHCATILLNMIERLGRPSDTVWDSDTVISISVPLMSFPSTRYYYYLAVLFIYRLVSPIICLSKWPRIASLAVPFLLSPPGEGNKGEGGRIDPYVFNLLPFYVFGFVIGGGCLPAESRDDCRSWWNSLLADARVQLLAVCYLLGWYALVNSVETEMPRWIGYGSPLWIVPSSDDIFLGLWQRGLAMMTVMAFVAVSFSLARFNLLSVLGSRTLYVYVLHPIFLHDENLTEFLRRLCTRSEYNKATMIAMHYFLIFIVTAVLSSTLTLRLTHAFVQPQWLLSLLQIQLKD
jgi:fucose 4-O-acetylase-like acetyltransferase